MTNAVDLTPIPSAATPTPSDSIGTKTVAPARPPVGLHVQMSGQIIVPIKKGWEHTGDIQPELEIRVVGVEHTPMLALPFHNILDVTPMLPRLECSYMDSSGRQFVMIDITGYSIRVGASRGAGVQRGPLHQVLELVEVGGPHTEKEYNVAGGVAATLLLDRGMLCEDSVSLDTASAYQGTTRLKSVGRLAAALKWFVLPETIHTLTLRNGIGQHVIRLWAAPLADGSGGYDPSPLLLQLSALCGWNGRDTLDDPSVDLDAAATLFPGKTYLKVKFDIPQKHPGSSKCDPNRVTLT